MSGTFAFRGRLAAVLVVGFSLGSSIALQPRQERLRFDALAIDPPTSLAIRAVATRDLTVTDPLQRGWSQFASAHGGWNVWLDERSGLPTLASGKGIPWFAGPGNDLPQSEPPTLVALERQARAFLAEHELLLGRFADQLVLDESASGPSGDRVWLVSFRQVVGGVPVDGARYDFQIVQGNLVAFGATRWAAVRTSPRPRFDEAAAEQVLERYLDLEPGETIERHGPGQLHLVPVDPRGPSAGEWRGPRGVGLDHRLVWRVTFTVPGEPATWIADVDASHGVVTTLRDDTRYERVTGGVYPLSNDGFGAEGVEQPDLPMPFVDYSIDNGGAQFSDDFGIYQCQAGTVRTRLSGSYFRVADNCGATNEAGSCSAGVDLKTSVGTDCAIPPGSSAGNTHAARSSFYHLNRAAQTGRGWLPDNGWLQSQVVDNVNINNTCNAFWNGSVNFYRSGGGCRNTGELQGVFVHEWGHGLDQNDGGGYDNSSEAYADIVAIFYARESCVGRGFFEGRNCSGYGDACLSCSGIREMDWDKRAAHTPATPQGFLSNNCGGGGGPCGREVHCESYPAAETLYDLATRDLPAQGLDNASGWQTAEKLWYLSRKGSGGNAYNCALPSADGCGTNSWYHKLRLVDDDDGDLSNGTPHAAALYAAFARHGIACGAAGDPANQNHATCGPISRPAIVQASKNNNSVRLAWTASAGASRYRVYRSDLGCDRGQVVVATVNAPTTSFTDDGVPDDFTTYYRVQAFGPADGCDSPVSTCETQRRPLTAFVTERGKGALTAVGVSTGNFAPIAFGLTQPAGVMLNRAETLAFVTEEGSGEISSVDINTGLVTRISQGLSAPRGTPRLNAAESQIFVAEAGSGELSRVAIGSGATTVVTSGLQTPIDVVLDAAERTAYVTESGRGALTAVDLASGSKRTITTGLNSPRFVRLDSRELNAVVTEGTAGSVALVNLYTGAISRDGTGLALPLGLDLNCSENTAFVAENNSGELSAVTLSNGISTAVASALSQPVGVALRRDDPVARAIPREIKDLRFSDKVTLTWGSEATYAGSGVSYDLLRGDLADVATYAGAPNDRCVADDNVSITQIDGTVPPPGSGFFYLVRGNNSCGAGRYQTGIAGADRTSPTCR